MGGMFYACEIPSFTKEQLKEIALNQAGIVTTLSGGYTTKGSNANCAQHGYVMYWDGTKVGNSGSLRLQGTTGETQKWIHLGQIKKMAHMFPGTPDESYKKLLAEIEAVNNGFYDADDEFQSNYYWSTGHIVEAELQAMKDAYEFCFLRA